MVPGGRPDGQLFLTYLEVAQRLEQERQEKEQTLQQLAKVQEKRIVWLNAFAN